MHSTSIHMSNVARTLRGTDKPLTLATARRCVAACVDYLWHDDGSPQASEDLQESVKVIEREAFARGKAEAIAERLVK